ncbi:MAG: hypothetical protein MHPSP_000424, partial [Paramarteilia canceri]
SFSSKHSFLNDDEMVGHSIDSFSNSACETPILCLVCGDRANGIHYGIISCEGCKGFFRRAMMRSKPHECSSGGNCYITPALRSKCAACRFNKCLSMGMATDAIKLGRRSNKHKMQLLNSGSFSSLTRIPSIKSDLKMKNGRGSNNVFRSKSSQSVTSNEGQTSLNICERLSELSGMHSSKSNKEDISVLNEYSMQQNLYSPSNNFAFDFNDMAMSNLDSNPPNFGCNVLLGTKIIHRNENNNQNERFHNKKPPGNNKDIKHYKHSIDSNEENDYPIFNRHYVNIPNHLKSVNNSNFDNENKNLFCLDYGDLGANQIIEKHYIQGMNKFSDKQSLNVKNQIYVSPEVECKEIYRNNRHDFNPSFTKSQSSVPIMSPSELDNKYNQSCSVKVKPIQQIQNPKSSQDSNISLDFSRKFRTFISLEISLQKAQRNEKLSNKDEKSISDDNIQSLKIEHLIKQQSIPNFCELTANFVNIKNEKDLFELRKSIWEAIGSSLHLMVQRLAIYMTEFPSFQDISGHDQLYLFKNSN